MLIDVERELRHIRASLPDGNDRQAAYAALAKRARAPVQKERNVPTFTQLVQENMKNGLNADAAWSLACQQSPEGYERYRQGFIDGQPVQKVMDTPPQQVRVSDPPGTVQQSDGTLQSWDEQVKYWKQDLSRYHRYRNHFSQQR